MHLADLLLLGLAPESSPSVVNLLQSHTHHITSGKLCANTRQRTKVIATVILKIMFNPLTFRGLRGPFGPQTALRIVVSGEDAD